MISARPRPSSRQGRLILRGSISFFALLLAVGLACSPLPPLSPVPAATVTAAPTASISPSSTPSPVPPTPLPLDSGWLGLAPGLEQRTLRVTNPAGDTIETMTLLRIEPANYQFDVLYTPGQARTVQQWAADSGATVTLNAGYYTPEYIASGLVVVDGVPHGQSYSDFGGMLAVRPDGVQVRWLSELPYDPNEPLTAAVQSFPMLIRPGGVLGFPEEDGVPARRTVIAQDRAGSIIIAVCPFGAFTLHKLATYLLQSDLDLEVALNLDGGTSTGLSLSFGAERIEIPSIVPVPAVITLRPKII